MIVFYAVLATTLLGLVLTRFLQTRVTKPRGKAVRP